MNLNPQERFSIQKARKKGLHFVNVCHQRVGGRELWQSREEL